MEALNKGANHYLQKGGDIGSMFGTLAHMIKEEADKKRMEDKLAAVEKERQMILDYVRDVIWSLDIKNLRFTYITPSIMHLTGHSVEEVMSLTLEELLTSTSYGQAMKTLAEELTIERSEQKDLLRTRMLELELNCKDGSTIWGEAKVTFLRDAESQPVGILGVSRDITERKRFEEALRESEEKYRNLVERANDGIAIVQDTVIKYVNPSLAEAVGYTLEELIGTPFADYVHPDDLPKVVDRYKRRIAGEDFPPVYEIVVRHKDGGKVYVEVNAGIIIYQGKPAEFVIARDITERIRAKEDLIRLSNAVRMSTDSIVITDLEGKIIEVNEATLKMYGTEDKECLIGKLSFDLIAPQERERAFAGMEEVLEKGFIRNREYHVITKDGGRNPVEMSVAIMKDADDQPIGFVAISRDITERKRAEEALQQSENYLRTIFNSVQTGVILVDVETHQIVDVNPVIIKAFGADKDEIIGSLCHQFICPAEKGKCPITDLGQTVDNAERILVKANGEQVLVLKTVVPVMLNNRKFLLESFVDITERKRFEEALRHSEEYFRAITENASDIVVILNKKGTITYVSPSIERFSGYKSEELIGKSGLDCIMPADLPRAIIDFGKAILTKETAIPNTFRVRHKDGSERVLEGLGKNLLDNPAVAGFVTNCRDVTERKKAEEALKKQMTHVERLNSLFVGREHRMVELKREVNALLEELGVPPKYEAPEMV